ncbi:MAG TPA: SpoIIE family protein phosphatase [Polyangiales bacterium]|nr:SpoIIE family protein phosphatase [Polyangiales bacterium]
MKATIAHETVPKLGEAVNGDAVLVRRDDADRLMFAVVDGLGHGVNAATVATAALGFLQTAQLFQPLYDLMVGLNEALRGTRGAAATVCVLRDRALEICAVGNVQLSCLRANVPLVLSSGVLGVRVAKYRVCEAKLEPGARLALYSDGVSSKFRLDESRLLTPSQACKAVLERHRKREDDATILIADMEK